jgi:uncharacterized protein (DUF924 family)
VTEVSSQMSSAAGEPAWVAEVLGFWFGELTEEAWFRRDEAVDRDIARRFAGLHREIAAATHPRPDLTPRLALATILVLDQFPRNIHRGTPAAFASDDLARTVAEAALRAGLDSVLDKHGRLFLYLPFEHSENADDQRRAVELISALGDAELTRYAVAHRVIIDRFGRFPHRNAILGRVSTPEETAFLQQPDSSF